MTRTPRLRARARIRAACMLLAGAALPLAAAHVAEAVPERAEGAAAFHERAVVQGPVEPGGSHAVALTPAAIEALEEGGEVRVFDAAGREIPSLVHTAQASREVLTRTATLFNRAHRDGTRTQTVTVELEPDQPRDVNAFVFDIADEHYHARVRIEGQDDGGEWLVLADGLRLIRLSDSAQSIRFRHDTLRIPTARFRRYRFTLDVDDPGSGAFEGLEIRAIQVRQIVATGSSLRLPLAILRYEDERDDDPRHHYWKLALRSDSLGIDRVQLAIAGSGYARSASLWEWDDARRRRTRRLATGVLFAFEGERQDSLEGFTTDAQTLALMIDQGDDVPVSLRSAWASRPEKQVRFLGPSNPTLPLALHFRPDHARTPRYDLARKLRAHDVTAFTQLQLAALEKNPSYQVPPPPASERIPYLLYALVVPLVLGLGWYVARTLRRIEDPPPA